MGITLIFAFLALLLALGVGVTVGWRRGPVLGIALGFGVLVAAIIGYVGVASTYLPM